MRILKGLLSFLFLIAIVGAAALGVGWFWLQSEVSGEGPLETATVFEVAPGETLYSVAIRMESDGIITDSRLLRLHARITGQETAIKTGEFEIPARISVASVLDRLVAGDIIQYTVTVPEGRTTAQIGRILEANTDLEGPLPDPMPGEGELLPETYAFNRGTTRAQMVQRMAQAQDELIGRLWDERAPDIPVASANDAIILASVVQKEAAGQDEYGEVASVFINRLNRPMRLQSDPTVIYGVSRGDPLYNRNGQRRTLYRSELDTDTPWNTYTRDGLPQTAIANPGRGAIEAVLNPPTTNYYYFVANGTGGHSFATTLAEHERNVAAFRAWEREEIAREREQP